MCGLPNPVAHTEEYMYVHVCLGGGVYTVHRGGTHGICGQYIFVHTPTVNKNSVCTHTCSSIHKYEGTKLYVYILHVCACSTHDIHMYVH